MPHAATEQAVYKQIAIDIASKVVNGRYRPGQKIHGRSPLASQYNVSPETVRRAVFLLNQVGVLQVRQGAGITILSVENAEEFLSKSNERQSLDTIKNHIDRLMLEQKQLNSRLQENINILLDANDRFNYLNPLTPFELAIEEGCPLVGQTIASVHFWNSHHHCHPPQGQHHPFPRTTRPIFCRRPHPDCRGRGSLPENPSAAGRTGTVDPHLTATVAVSIFFALSFLCAPDIIRIQIMIFVKPRSRKEVISMSKNEQSHKEKPVSELLQEQSKELKTYIDTKHREMEELLAESEGRLSEQLREHTRR